MEDNRIHLWLDLEPSYIDSNFENVLDYLRQCDITRCFDSFYLETIELIKKRVTSEIDKISNERIYNYLEMDEDRIRYRSRLLLLYLVATKCDKLNQSERSKLRKNILSTLNLPLDYPLITAQMNRQNWISQVEEVIYSYLNK